MGPCHLFCAAWHEMSGSPTSQVFPHVLKSPRRICRRVLSSLVHKLAGAQYPLMKNTAMPLGMPHSYGMMWAMSHARLIGRDGAASTMGKWAYPADPLLLRSPPVLQKALDMTSNASFHSLVHKLARPMAGDIEHASEMLSARGSRRVSGAAARKVVRGTPKSLINPNVGSQPKAFLGCMTDPHTAAVLGRGEAMEHVVQNCAVNNYQFNSLVVIKQVLCLSIMMHSNTRRTLLTLYTYDNLGNPNHTPSARDPQNQVTLVSGDLLTIQHLRSLQMTREEESMPCSRVQFMVPIIGLFHLKMVCTGAMW
ncbi:uncharacterized protein LACBIDRAFT_332741 [Laccaria bicolor S238N-H82]|uniref:Predicted protein n=1 Tax=Laccaria bicolor (strain S238N-H82 / ATCC MYA-4686) TaxID=486041 RepID=B0DTX9_LACBS|nr:uncharacterized protein LACBIDRAFT_332741 [Laccaria bicolor S238N-H82]EDR01991.1 predicted protein [Laccaria bicolor S238N-H82]|eukprot:XP_001887382.1 predicted protein [Laccaria bicolor S238N-H82]